MYKVFEKHDMQNFKIKQKHIALNGIPIGAKPIRKW